MQLETRVWSTSFAQNLARRGLLGAITHWLGTFLSCNTYFTMSLWVCWMRSLPLSNLNRRPGEIVDMALAAPVALTKHGRRSVILMSAEAYDSLVSGRSAQKAIALEPATLKQAGPSFLARQALKVSRDEEEDRSE